jgi:sugar diacid utilization regulator
MSDLQGIVDALAATLGRPVGVDDRRLRALAYSSHGDGVDPVRLASILQREAPRAVTAWLESLGMDQVERFLRVSANAQFGMAARVCIPIRFDGTLLGYLWLIDEPQPLSATEIEESLLCMQELGVELFRLRRLEHEERERERELLRELFGDVAGGRPSAAGAALVSDGYLAAVGAYAVLVVAATHPDGREAPDSVRVHLAAAAEHARRAAAPRHLLLLVAGEQVIVLLACADTAEVVRRGQALARVAQESLANDAGWSVVVAVGDTRSSPQELHRAREEAQLALRLARRVGGTDPLVSWSALGAYRVLMRLADDRDLSALIPESIRRLLASSDAPTLVPTLECYLDRAGDARAAADALYVHRSSLYARLRRIEEIAGIDLHVGDDRLELHLGLRLWRLAGGTLSG